MNKHEGGGKSHRRPVSARNLVRAANTTYDRIESLGSIPSSYTSNQPHTSNQSMEEGVGTGIFFNRHTLTPPAKEKKKTTGLSGKPNLKKGGTQNNTKLLLVEMEEEELRDPEIYSQGFQCRMDYLPHLVIEEESHSSWFTRTSGMQTVSKWLNNYLKHPAGWGALILIHGVDEVSSRLRSKVENYAVYSAVLLSASSVLLVLPQSLSDDIFTSSHWALRRIYLYSMVLSVASHTTAILLSMAFINALNEAGRDADVIRMLAEGQGFIATEKCKFCFRFGLAMFCVGVITTIVINYGVFDGGVAFFLFLFFGSILAPTSNKLFRASSIIEYWRFGTQKVKIEDPFDLGLSLESVKKKCATGERLHDIIKESKKEVEKEKEEFGKGGGFNDEIMTTSPIHKSKQPTTRKVPTLSPKVGQPMFERVPEDEEKGEEIGIKQDRGFLEPIAPKNVTNQENESFDDGDIRDISLTAVSQEPELITLKKKRGSSKDKAKRKIKKALKKLEMKND